MKKKISLENLMCFYIYLCPILDILSFLFRNYFNTLISPTTFIRPIIPAIIFTILFFKEKNKKQKLIVGLIYLIYSTIHLLLFQKLHNISSYGNIKNEIQYIINYSLMITNLYLFYRIIKNKEKTRKAVCISFTIYVLSLFFAILTNTSSSTYIEGVGYKGYFESGNSLCTVLILSICIIFSKIKLNEWKTILIILFAGIYLCLFSGMRTGLFGFSLVCLIFILTQFYLWIKKNNKITKKIIILVALVVVFFIILIFQFSSKTLERRKILKLNEQNNIDEETLEQRYVTGDILKVYKQIKNRKIEESYMSKEEQKAIVEFCDFAKKIRLSNVNLRLQQVIYNLILVKEQKDISLILFGNGYKNQTGELVMEMEIPALLINFGVWGFILYFGPFLIIMFKALKKQFKEIKKIDSEFIMYISGSGLAILLSCFSGYVYFNLSSMTMVIILNVLLLKKTGELSK